MELTRSAINANVTALAVPILVAAILSAATRVLTDRLARIIQRGDRK